MNIVFKYGFTNEMIHELMDKFPTEEEALAFAEELEEALAKKEENSEISKTDYIVLSKRPLNEIILTEVGDVGVYIMGKPKRERDTFGDEEEVNQEEEALKSKASVKEPIKEEGAND